MLPRCTQPKWVPSPVCNASFERWQNEDLEIAHEKHINPARKTCVLHRVDKECNEWNSKYSHIYSHCDITMCCRYTVYNGLHYTHPTEGCNAWFFPGGFIQFTESWALLQVEIYRMPGSKWGFESQEPPIYCWDFGPWMVMIKEHRGNNNNNNNNNNICHDIVKYGWICQEAFLFADRAFAQHLSVKVHWLCQWTFLNSF